MSKQHPQTKRDYRQEKFCEFVASGHSARKSALMAGYSKNGCGQSAYRLMQKDHIKERIDILKDADVQAEEIDRLRIIRELYEIASADLEDWLEIGADGYSRVRDPANRPRRARKALKKFKCNEKFDRDGNLLSRDVDIELYDKIKCKELLGKELGMFAQKIDAEMGVHKSDVDYKAMFDSMSLDEKMKWLKEHGGALDE